jgi:hypothetical protein
MLLTGIITVVTAAAAVIAALYGIALRDAGWAGPVPPARARRAASSRRAPPA